MKKPIKLKLFKFKNLSLRTKVIMSFALIIAIITVVALYNLYRVDQIKEQFTVQNNNVEKQHLAMELKQKVQILDVMTMGLAISRDNKITEAYMKEKVLFLDLVQKIADNSSTREQRKWRAALVTTSKEFASNFDIISSIVNNSLLEAETSNQMLQQQYKMSQAHKTYIFQLTDKYYEVFTQEANASLQQSSNLLDYTVQMLIVAIFIVLLVSLTVTILFVRSFVGPIRKLQSAMKQIALGDLRVKINSNSHDELGQLSQDFDHMTEQMSHMLVSTQHIAEGLTELSTAFELESRMTAAAGLEIVRAMDEISSGADQQAEQAERSVIGINDLEQDVLEISSITDQMKQLSAETTMNTNRGDLSLQALSHSAIETEDRLHIMVSSLDTLAKLTKEISKISNAITDISSQTNLLAINATIEAALAGEQGRGFAVIADQVRQLSTESKESSNNIFLLVQSLQKQMSVVQEKLTETGHSLDEQNSKIVQTSEAFKTIEQSAEHMAAAMTSIHSSVEHARIKNQSLVQSIHVVSGIAEETAAGVEEANSTASQQESAVRRIADQAIEVNTLAQQLFTEIRRFQVVS
ncbi:MAG: methyl-accepting chemotaxis protein [Paenibacillaceae bacterium]